jgi:hypothetical protein
MSEKTNGHLNELMQLSSCIAQQAEVCEAIVENVNDAIARLAASGLVNEVLVLGNVIMERDFDVRDDSDGETQVIQAACMIPAGVGVIEWSLSAYLDFTSAPPHGNAEPLLRFTAFSNLPAAVKAAILPEVEGLLTSLRDCLPLK